MNYGIVDSTGEALDLDSGRFVAAARERWDGQVTSAVFDLHENNLCTIEVQPVDGPAFQIMLLGPETQVSTDGTDEQALEVAAWVRSLLPANNSSEVWFIDEGFTGHAVLTLGMSADAVKSAWVEHDD